MHLFGAFELEIQPVTPDNPASVRVALLRYTRGEDGRLFITPECNSFDEVEGQVNSLQDELDETRNEPPSVSGRAFGPGSLVDVGPHDVVGIAERRGSGTKG